LAREKQDRDRYLCAYIVTDDKDAPNQGSHTSELREYLSHLLPDYMVPSFYVKMARMPLTPNGKINRSLLPEPGFKDGTTKYTAPRHHLERQLAAIWSQVLGIEREKTGIDDNFFQSGGHSLKATILVAKVHKELNVRLPLAELFKTPTIRGLARRIRQSIIHRHLSIAPQEKKEYYILSSAQKRLYILQQADLKSVSYNMSGVFTFTGDLSRDRFEYTCQALIRRHEALRTSFCQVKGEVFQEIEDHISPKLVYKEISHEKQVTKQIREFVKSFDLSRAPLFRVELIKLTEKKHFVLFDVHHIISDGSSLRLLIEDFARLYRGTPPGALSVHYKDYAAWQDKRINKEKEEYEGYWLEKLRGFAFTRIPIDRYDSYNRIEGKARHLEVRPPLYDEIEIFCNKHDITKFTFMITVFNIVLAREIDQADITVGTPVSIKNHHDLKDVMGIFLNVLLIRTIIDDEDSFVNHLAKTKETVVSALNNRDYPYEMLNAKMNEIHDLKRDELFSVLFNYFPVQENKEIISKDIEIRSLELPEVTPKYDMTLYVQDAYKNKSMVLNSVYKSNIYDLDTIKSVLRGVLDVIHRVLENEHIKLSQLTLPGEVYEESYDDFDMKLENMYKNEYDYN
jgi:acyl carrier protein